ncbi:PHP domain-containing protein [Alicyclobacillus ferrooxydans]|uniref:DNA-directed DNA polymerase n=1 Tax=Alicyclobacillus ferrooxydans TaxID=471514 RepID=A0A0P9GPW1_9BACL|nr:PHP domain-containing protein [Alicyclobacillus ferrooxydans]KPV42737.1 hypothetical protein AN477_15380 [Alicyclobacillus ferrooxydans]
MDKLEIVRCLRLANDLWAIEGANLYSIRAHSLSADAISDSPLSIGEILSLPPGSIKGVGRETLAMVTALQEGGMQALLQRLHVNIPLSCAELLRLPGIGPKTAHALVHQFGIHCAEELNRALQNGSLQGVPGIGSKRLARLRRDLRVFLDRKHSIPIALAWPLGIQLVELVSQIQGVSRASLTGSLRRSVVAVPEIEVIAALDNAGPLTEWAAQFTLQKKTSKDPVCREDLSKNSTDPISGQSGFNVLLPVHGDDIPVHIHTVTEADYARRLMETTGDQTHQAVISGLLMQQNIEWNRDSLQVNSEEEIYALLGLPYFPPEVREDNGLLCTPSRLIQPSDIMGDLHVHSTWSDGSLSISEIAQMAEELGYEYIAVTDHSQSLTIANGLTPERLRQQREEIAEVQKHTPVRILHGSEVDILADGRLDLPDDTLFELDLVIASVHSAMHQTKEEMTERILRAIEHPAVHIIGHLTGRILGRRSGYDLDLNRIVEAAFTHGVMLELNANPNRLDIFEQPLRTVKAKGMLVPINTDTHHRGEFQNINYGVRMAQRGWLYQENVLNALPYTDLIEALHRPRQSP